MTLPCGFAYHASCETLTLYPMGAAVLGVLFCYGPMILTASAISRKTTSCFPAPPPRFGPMKLAAVMIVTGCRCDLVWHCRRKGNGDCKANHGNDERGYYNSSLKLFHFVH